MSDSMQTGLLWLVGALIVLVVLLYVFRRRTTSAPNDLPMSADDPARALFAAAGDEPPTEDQIAQARLGGVRGNPKLGRAEMSGQAREQTPKHIDDGHVA
jgi:hypothetical protein